MIPLAVITAFLTTIISLFFNSISKAWTSLKAETKEVYAANVQTFIEEVRKDFADKLAKQRTKEPDDFKGNPDEVRAWCRRMMLFFQSNGISKEWERIKMALGKIKGGKDNWAQRWADTQIRKFLPFQKEWKETDGELDISTMTNKPPFETWEKMTNEMAQFFISIETQTHAIDKLTKLKQENRLLEDFWSEFVTWKELSGYNEVVLVGLFKKEVHPALARKLVEIGQMWNLDSLDEWYEKVLSFERLRKEAIEEFGGRRSLENLGDVKKKLVLDVLRQDPNTMDVDRHREMRRCYNCGEMGYLAARYSKLRKERSEEVRMVNRVKEDFSLGRE